VLGVIVVIVRLKCSSKAKSPVFAKVHANNQMLQNEGSYKPRVRWKPAFALKAGVIHTYSYTGVRDHRGSVSESLKVGTLTQSKLKNTTL
jgi:hypothetical protein